MRLAPSRAIAILVTIAFISSLGSRVYSQRLVNPNTAQDCGCTLRKWPLLSDFLARTLPNVGSLQPETLLPHYVDAGCGQTPSMPARGIYGEVRFSRPASLDLFIDHDG